MLSEKFPNYDVSTDGTIYKDGVVMKPFKSNKYLQVVLYDIEHKSHVMGVHAVVAMKYIKEWRPGCVVHHVDGDTHNNNVTNLEIYSRSEHCRLHGKKCTTLANYVKQHGPHNKGKTMSESYKEACRRGARKRVDKYGFLGNQYVDKYGNRREN